MARKRKSSLRAQVLKMDNSEGYGRNVALKPGGATSGGGKNAAGQVQPTINLKYDPLTGAVEPTTTPVPVPVGGAGKVAAAPAGVTGLDGRSLQDVGGGDFNEPVDEHGVKTAFKNTTHWLSSLFNPDDDSDLNVAGLNLSTVESVWDAGVKGLGMAADTAAWGLSGTYLALNPTYWANRDQGVEGNLWQDATTISPGRAYDALKSSVTERNSLLGVVVKAIPGQVGNMSNAPSIYGLDPSIDVGDPRALQEFASGQPKMTLNLPFDSSIDLSAYDWSTGLTDAGTTMIADPANVLGLGIGKVAKLGRLRFLNKPILTVEDTEKFVGNLARDRGVFDANANYVDPNGVPVSRPIEDLAPDEVAGLNVSDEARFAWEVSARKETADSLTRRADIDAMTDPAVKAQAVNDFVPAYEKRLKDTVIYEHEVIRNATNRDALTAALFNARNFDEASLILRHAVNDRTASAALNTYAPHLYKAILDGERSIVSRMVTANPELVGTEVARWEARTDALAKRLDDLDDLAADPGILADIRVQLDDAMDMWEHAQTGYMSRVGSGPTASMDDIDLARRAIDVQLEGNERFVRSLQDAGGNPNPGLAGSLFGQSSKGFTGDPGNSVLPGFLGDMSEKASATVLRSVSQSRMDRAARRAIAANRQGKLGVKVAQAEGVGAKAKAIAEGFANNWKVDEFYGVRPVGGLGLLAPPIARMFRWMPVERQGFVIHTSGVGAQESVREIRAMLNGVDIYSGAPRVIDGVEVGGLARKEAIVQQYQNAMLIGGDQGDMMVRSLIDQVEEQLLTDVAKWNGLDPKLLREVHYRQNRKLEKIEKEIAEQGYWVDEHGVRNYAPYLESQLQNGTFLKNWRRINSVARQYALKERAQMGDTGTIAKGQYMGGYAVRLTGRTLDGLNEAMQEFWRPAVLIRLGYTQRNVAEGLFRSSAFAMGNPGSHRALGGLYAPFKPWVDAGRQAALSTGNVARKAAGANRRAKDVTEAAASGAVLADMPKAFRNWHAAQVRSAEYQIQVTRDSVLDSRGRLAHLSPEYRAERVEYVNNRYERVLAQQADSRATLADVTVRRDALLARESALNARVANGQTLGVKAQKELDDDIPAQLGSLNRLENETVRLIGFNTERLVDYGDEIDTLSRMTDQGVAMDPSQRSLIRDLDHLEEIDLPFQQSVLASLDDMTAAARAYRLQAAPKARTYGRSSSMGDPDSIASIVRQRVGEDPFAQSETYGDIAWQNMSANATMQQVVSMRMKAVGDSLSLQEMRYYVAVNPGDANYFDGSASVINQFQNSDIGKMVIAARAAGKGDSEIVDDVVRFLYEDGRGQEIAAFVNQANDILFGGSFESARVRTGDAMRRAVEHSAPLQTAADEAKDALRVVQRDATSVRMQQPRPRFAGDALPPSSRSWSGDVFGVHEVSTQGRGLWSVTDNSTGAVVSATTRGEARRLARDLQTQTDDAARFHWQTGPYTTPSGNVYASLTEAQAAVAASRTLFDDATEALDSYIAKHSVPAARTGVDSHRLNTTELEDAREYATEVLRRYDVVTDGNADLQTYLAANPQLPFGGGRYSQELAGEVIKDFLGDSTTLQPIIGNMAVFVGEAGLMDLYRKGVAASFRALGTIPEDLLVRSQFYGRVFTEHAQRLLDNTVGQVGEDGLRLSDINLIRQQAHRRALKDTKDTLYTIDRRTNLGDSMERFIPFVSATQNSVTAVGKLMWRDPSVIWAMSQIWQAPDRLFPDRDDNPDTIHVPIGWIPEEWRAAIGVGDYFITNKRSLDLIFNGATDPQGPPLVGISSSELMKSGWFGVTPDTPEGLFGFVPLKDMPGGDALWGYWKDYTLGKEGGASEYFASVDRMLAPWQKRMFDTFLLGPGSAASFGRVYQSYMLTESLNHRNGERENPPSHDEILGKARAAMTLRAIANLTFFTTPQYDVFEGVDDSTITMSEEVSKQDELFYADQQRIKNLQAQGVDDPAQLQRQVISSEELYGDLVVQSVYGMQGTRENSAGIKISDYGVKLAKENADVIAQVAPTLESTDNLGAIGILTEDTSEWYNGVERTRTPVADNPEWSQNAAAYFAANEVPGTNELYREPESAEATNLKASDRVAWRKYLIGLDAIKLDMEKNGVGSFESNEGYLYKQLKKDLVAGIDREHKGWGANFIEQQGSRTNAAIRVLTTAFNTPAFVQRNEDNPFWSKSGPPYQYLTERALFIETVTAIKADAGSQGVNLQSKKALPWNEQIAAAESRWQGAKALLAKSPTWSAIADRWVGDDDDPKNLMSDMYLTNVEEAS